MNRLISRDAPRAFSRRSQGLVSKRAFTNHQLVIRRPFINSKVTGTYFFTLSSSSRKRVKLGRPPKPVFTIILLKCSLRCDSSHFASFETVSATFGKTIVKIDQDVESGQCSKCMDVGNILFAVERSSLNS